ncbi:MAG: hypothetical protein Q4B67_03485 [Eubacteriales bacterium]|nr:hypothetical protein [Eubacteriales bacterium]
MRKLTILVDMDDTIENLLDRWLDLLNERYGLDKKRDDITDWAMGQFFPGIPEEELLNVEQEKGFWDEVKPIEGAVEGLKKLIDDGHEVYIVTNASYQGLRERMDNCLFKYFPYLKWKNVIVTTNKHLIKGDVLIDDALHNHAGGEYKHILMDAPYNRSFDAEAAGYVRVHNWSEILDEIDRLAR